MGWHNYCFTRKTKEDPTMFRVGTQQLQQGLLSRIGQNTAEIARLQEQTSTGKVGTRFSQLDDQASLQIDLSARRRQLTQYIETGENFNARLDTANKAVDSVLDVAIDVRNKIIQAMSAGVEDRGKVTEVAKTAIGTVTDALNINMSGTYLFAGDASDKAPVDSSDLTFLTEIPPDSPPGTTAGYYRGGTAPLTARLDDGDSTQYGITADRAGFRDLFAALKKTNESGGNFDQLRGALSLINRSIEDITDAQATLGTQQAQGKITIERQRDVKLTLEQQLGDVENIDLAETISRLAQTQSLLQGSYTALSRITQLSLLDSIR
jgi:flagellar hook-associated protein 3 FlgL